MGNRVLNMHFAMPLRSMAVELMTDGQADSAALELFTNELPAVGLLLFVAARENTGFIVNRIWAAIKREALAVGAEGVSTRPTSTAPSATTAEGLRGERAPNPPRPRSDGDAVEAWNGCSPPSERPWSCCWPSSCW